MKATTRRPAAPRGLLSILACARLLEGDPALAQDNQIFRDLANVFRTDDPFADLANQE